MYTEVTVTIEVNSTVIYKCHKLLSLLYANVTSYLVCYIQMSQLIKSVIYKRQSYEVCFIYIYIYIYIYIKVTSY